MAAFLQDHGRAFSGVAPIAAHKGVRLVPIAYALNGLDGLDFAHRAGIQQLLELLIKQRIAQHMAYDHMTICLPRQPFELAAFRLGFGDGLFQQQMIPLAQRGGRLAKVQPVGRADEHGVRQPWLTQHALGAVIALRLRQAIALAHQRQLPRANIGRRHNAHAAGKKGLTWGIRLHAARAAARDGNGDGLHIRTLLLCRMTHSL